MGGGRGRVGVFGPLVMNSRSPVFGVRGWFERGGD